MPVIEFAPGVDLRKLTIKGTVKAQVDTELFCLMPTAYPFMAAREPPGTGTANPFMGRLRSTERRPFCRWLGQVVKRSQANARQ